MSSASTKKAVAVGTNCSRCGAAVGLLWLKGHSTLIDAQVVKDAGGKLVVTPHRCSSWGSAVDAVGQAEAPPPSSQPAAPKKRWNGRGRRP